MNKIPSSRLSPSYYRFLLSIAALGGLSAGQAEGAVTTYTSSSSFMSALGAEGLTARTQDFEGITAGTTYSDPATMDWLTLMNSSVADDLLVTNQFETTSGDNYLGLDNAANSNLFLNGLTIDLSWTGSAYAIGLNFITAEVPNVSLFDDDISLTVATAGNGTVVANLDVDAQDGTLPAGDRVFFIGIIDDTNPFSSANLDTVTGGGPLILFNIDDVTTGIPEPSTTLLLLGSLLLVGRRKR